VGENKVAIPERVSISAKLVV